MVRRWPFVILALASSVALAEPYDLQLSRLGNPQAGGFGYSNRADGNFRIFARQFAAAISGLNLAPPETLGSSGFSVTAEMALVDFGIAPSNPYQLPSQSIVQSPLKLYSLHVRKGLPASFELGARGAWIEQSRMGAATLEVKWAINEGFTYFPDIAIRGSVTKLINGRDLDLTTGGLDLGIGKQFALGGVVTITPYAGWNLAFVGATSNTVDFHPTRTLAESDAANEQFTNFYVFTSVPAAANAHNRFYAGFRLIAGIAQIGAEISYAVFGRFREESTKEDRDVPSVLVGGFHLGLDF